MRENATIWPGRMNATDALFWSMDTIPELRSMIGTLIIVERPLERQRLRDEFERLSENFVRMRQRVVEVPWNLAPPEWVLDEQFDLDYHLRSIAIPGPGGMPELLSEVSPLFATPLDRSRPLWEAYLAEGLLGGRGAVFIKMHHCLIDGVGGTRLAEHFMTEAGPVGARAEPAAARGRSPADRAVGRTDTSPAALLYRAQLHNLGEAMSLAAALASSALAVAYDLPGALRGAWRGTRMLAGFASELIATPAESPLHRRRSLSRRLATFEIPLADIDHVRSRLTATNNDVVLAIVSGAMHRWHTSRGADVKQLRALVPVNLREEGDPAGGNRIALLAVPLPIGEPDPVGRLRLIQERMTRVKSDRRAALYPVLARAMTLVPFAFAAAIGQQQTRRANFVCTNVPGPRKPVYLAGQLVEAIYPYAPLVGDHPVAIALLSYRDRMCVGLDVDPIAMPDLPFFVDALGESLDEMVNVSRRAPIVSHDEEAPAAIASTSLH